MAFRALHLVVFGLRFGWHRPRGTGGCWTSRSTGRTCTFRLSGSPSPQSVGPSSDIRHESLLEAQRLQLEEHKKSIDKKLEAHHLSMAKLLGVPNQAVDATPADRGLDDESAR